MKKLYDIFKISMYTVKKISEIFPKIVGQLEIQMGRQFFKRYSRKYF